MMVNLATRLTTRLATLCVIFAILYVQDCILYVQDIRIAILERIG